jgi:hypothetical protein
MPEWHWYSKVKANILFIYYYYYFFGCLLPVSSSTNVSLLGRNLTKFPPKKYDFDLHKGFCMGKKKGSNSPDFEKKKKSF